MSRSGDRGSAQRKFFREADVKRPGDDTAVGGKLFIIALSKFPIL